MKKEPEPIPVKDRPLQAGINLNTVFTALMLAVMSWVGINIEQIKQSLGGLSSSVAVLQKDIQHLREDQLNHQADPFAHQRLRRAE